MRMRMKMVCTESTRQLILVLGIFVFVALYHQSRLLQVYLNGNKFFPQRTELEVPFTSDINTSEAAYNQGPVSPVRKWAYAFLIGGCSESKQEYRGFLYNVVVAAQRLKTLGSKADVVLMVQMSTFTNETKLPETDLAILDSMGVRVHYLPKMAAPVHEVFYGLVQEKFRILELTEYSRVLFLDGDIMPFCNLDYLFDLSEPGNGTAGMLKENVVLSWKNEAANAGFFILKPDKEDFQRLINVIRTKEEKALELPFPHWDEVEGWGHRIEPPDFWRSEGGTTGKNWTWHAVFADQGLLYFWTKYVKQSVSLIIGNEVENWGNRDGKAYLETTMVRDPLTKYTCVPPDSPILQRGGKGMRSSPYRDFIHFTGALVKFLGQSGQ